MRAAALAPIRDQPIRAGRAAKWIDDLHVVEPLSGSCLFAIHVTQAQSLKSRGFAIGRQRNEPISKCMELVAKRFTYGQRRRARAAQKFALPNPIARNPIGKTLVILRQGGRQICLGHK